MKTLLCWIIAPFLVVFFGGFLVVLYNSHQNSPTFDPVTFDLSDYKPDGSSEKTPEDIFYVPAGYWADFPLDYETDREFITFSFDLANLGDTHAERSDFKDGVSVYINKFYELKNTKTWGLLDKLKQERPQKSDNNLKTYITRPDKYLAQEIFYVFKGFDGEDVVVATLIHLPGSPIDGKQGGGMVAKRKFNSNIEISYYFDKRNPSKLFEYDKKVVTYIKSLQVPPLAFTKLK